MFMAIVYFRKRRQIKIKGSEAVGRVWEGSLCAASLFPTVELGCLSLQASPYMHGVLATEEAPLSISVSRVFIGVSLCRHE